MYILYIILLIINILILCGFLFLVKKKEKWMYVLCSSTIIAIIGYLIISLSNSLCVAIIGNDIAYFGSVFLSLSMFMIISKMCKIKIPNKIVGVLIASAIVMFLIVATQGFLPWYYKTIELVSDPLGPKLVKTYSFLYPVYIIYVSFYMIGMIASVIHYSIHNKEEGASKYALFMTIAVGLNIVVWIGEKFIPLNFEFLTISYIISEMMFLFVYWLLQGYIQIKDIPKPKEEKTRIIFVDSKEKALKLEKILLKLPDGTNLSSRQMDILEGILDGKSRKEIAIDLCLSENTVKMHTTSLFRILKVSSREEIFNMVNSDDGKN